MLDRHVAIIRAVADEHAFSRFRSTDLFPIPIPTLGGSPGEQAGPSPYRAIRPPLPGRPEDGVLPPPVTGDLQGRRSTARGHTSVVPIASRAQFAYAAAGRLNVLYQDGMSGFGSGFLVQPDMVMTAGHVLYDHGHGWAKTIHFMPNYVAGQPQPPSLLFQAIDYAVHPGWIGAEPDYSRDVGMITLNRAANHAYFSVYEHTWSFGPQLHALGFPVLPGSGQSEFIEVQAQRSDYLPSKGLFSIDEDISDGASGGPWIDRFAGISRVDGTLNFVVGLTSVAFTGRPGEIFSPIIDASIVAFMRAYYQQSTRPLGV